MELIVRFWFWLFGGPEVLIHGFRNFKVCRWCGYGIYPGEKHEACELLCKKYQCQTCKHPVLPGDIHLNCKDYEKGVVFYPNCECCGKVLIPGKRHFPCEMELAYKRARICPICGFRIFTSKNLAHSNCEKRKKK